MLEACLRHDELPEWIADKKKRLAKIRAAKAALEGGGQGGRGGEARARAEAEEKRKAEGGKGNGPPPAPPRTEPDGKAQRNFSPGL